MLKRLQSVGEYYKKNGELSAARAIGPTLSGADTGTSVDDLGAPPVGRQQFSPAEATATATMDDEEQDDDEEGAFV